MPIYAADPHPRRRIEIMDTVMSYVDTGVGRPVVFIHGNPTSSYLWRNIIAHVKPVARCIAPDLAGMGRSTKSPSGAYTFDDHARRLDEWFDTLNISGCVLVCHDWGSALAFRWAHLNSERVAGIVYMEAIVQSLRWEQWPQPSRRIFQGFRSEAGERMILEQNMFVERVLPGSVIRDMTEREMEVYRRPYLEPGESRRPTLTWPREIPLGGEPKSVVEVVDAYSAWLSESDLPKLFVNAEPGAILTGEQREFCRSWPNQSEVTVSGSHFIQEDSPDEIGRAIVNWMATDLT